MRMLRSRLCGFLRFEHGGRERGGGCSPVKNALYYNTKLLSTYLFFK